MAPRLAAMGCVVGAEISAALSTVVLGEAFIVDDLWS